MNYGKKITYKSMMAIGEKNVKFLQISVLESSLSIKG
jgi:hypothetical protein